jgi:hypothetical protein
MHKYSYFLRWILFASLVVLGTFAAFVTGTFEKVNELDFTKLSFVIYFLFLACTSYTGYLTYLMCRDGHIVTSDDLKKFEAKNGISWFLADGMFTLGMIGTVAGFISVLSSNFTGINPNDINTTKAALSGMSRGMGTALYTTATGLICSLILRLQVFNTSYQIDDLSRKCACGGEENELPKNHK